MGYAYVASGPLVRSSYKAYVLFFVSNPHTGGAGEKRIPSIRSFWSFRKAGSHTQTQTHIPKTTDPRPITCTVCDAMPRNNQGRILYGSHAPEQEGCVNLFVICLDVRRAVHCRPA